MAESIFNKVLFVAPNYKYWKGGISSVIMGYKKAITDFNYVPSTTSSNIVITTISFPFLLIIFTWKLLANKNYKIVHIHGASKGSFFRKYVYFKLTRIMGRKVVYHMHGAGFHLFYKDTSPFVRKRIQYMINNADTLIVLSKWWQNFFNSEFRPKKIEIVPNIVEAPSVVNRSSHVKNEYLNLLFLGRVGDRKGIFDLLKVFSTDVSFFKAHFKLKVGGDGDIDRLKSNISEMGLSEMVEYIGFVEGEQKAKAIHKADIYVLPSYNEGLPISILEAMAYSKAVISTTVGGIPEIIEDGYNGSLIEPGNLEALKSALLQLLNDPSKLKLYGERSYKIVSKRHFPDAVLSCLYQLYSNIE
ncbi:glycosyltransferase family 4 protein [Porifericola rhodea]|uniref:glycosyltransferase family 4 protein n=1 Tax=Porifericola rhodea TaxID=930972 RepID=UPI0026654F93|nr:glycosyltransferase family 4 protein [Porifericola rhodea]WKN30485.1 glycosyltransferase family 4 protein [Porifericola rhodea]